MTEDTKSTDAAPPSSEVADGLGARAASTVEVHSGQALLVAQFADIEQARTAYDALRAAELRGAFEIDGVLVIKADGHGRIHIQKMTDHSTRHGLAWGAVAGVALGVIFPPSILVGAVTAGIGGAALGKLYSVARKDAVAEELAMVIAPGTSGIVALVPANAVDGVTSAIPEALVVRSVPIDDATADVVKAAATAGADPATT